MKSMVILEPQCEGGFTAFSPVFPGCVSEGETQDETLQNFLDALDGWMAVKTDLALAWPPKDRLPLQLMEVAL